MKLSKTLTALIVTAGLTVAVTSAQAASHGKPVNITPKLESVTVMHKGKETKIMRVQDNANTVNPAFAKTSRPCPPFCIQPMSLGKGIQTIGEVEVIDYADKMSKGDKNIMLVDSRTPDWVAKGTIPGAINVSWVELTPSKGATTEGIMKVMTEQFGVKLADGKDDVDVDEAIANGDTSEVFDFTDAKTLVMFCNGMWCGQSPASIAALRKFGYPADRIKYYRGGMQDWEILGLSTAK
ncbi:rhodanese-like domain-containing protein [Cocleimonas sp. KMM 6892]|uniref:rhodanese-like domain-containing protein n=1 Tax=unclassified Cocleimonas TaxID=2639732 RepID=UPI002DC050E8|nr:MULTISPECIES: rhodanese-like domain-containing protein [unclassified Cocleimonas]MEB8431533.1 rhodanese-like domain-containing protein [Cocleimonas sp. KMM 6892]MEC4713695.1 rhodanese-like domain-containing protein [Cocleimonas sp. KMM 6895]MEC4743026.1 rhodanese-like domain-containing protein [Cocleimonas sp. KMM 6896]